MKSPDHHYEKGRNPELVRNIYLYEIAGQLQRIADGLERMDDE